MRSYLTLLLLTIITNLALGQNAQKIMYSVIVKKGDSLFNLKEYNFSALTYSSAFKILGWRGLTTDRYNAARAWAMAGVPDSAFANLERISTKANYSNYDQILSETNFTVLHEHVRWQTLLKRILINKDANKSNLNKGLIKQLDSLVIEDQKWRNYYKIQQQSIRK